MVVWCGVNQPFFQSIQFTKYPLLCIFLLFFKLSWCKIATAATGKELVPQAAATTFAISSVQYLSFFYALRNITFIHSARSTSGKRTQLGSWSARLRCNSCCSSWGPTAAAELDSWGSLLLAEIRMLLRAQ